MVHVYRAEFIRPVRAHRSNSPAKCFGFTRFRIQIDKGDVLAENAEDAEEGIGLFGIRLYRFGFTRFRILMGTGDILAKSAKGAKEGIDLFGF